MGITRKHMRKINYFRSIKMHLLRQGTVCGICGKVIEDLAHATLDHIIPKSKGGSDAPRNLQVAHHWCNQEKGNRVEPDL